MTEILIRAVYKWDNEDRVGPPREEVRGGA
jgi:hypothetical protein